jgi:very-short-patch-repair endonuclease
MRPTEVDEVLGRIGARFEGIVTWRAASQAGVTAREFRYPIDNGRLIRLANGVCRLRDHPFTWRSALRAALAEAGDDAAAALRSAGRLHGAYAYRNAREIEVVRLRGGNHDLALGRLYRTRVLTPRDLTVVDGIPVTSLARTCFDLAGDPPLPFRGNEARRVLHSRHMERVVNDALARRGLTLVKEAAVLATIGKRGRAGTRMIREIITKFGPQYVPTYSDAESLFCELLELSSLPAPRRQVAMSDEQGWIGTVDFLFDPRLVVEIDSSWHDGPLDTFEDDVRDKRLEGLGYDVRRVRYWEMALHPRRLLAELDRRHNELLGTLSTDIPSKSVPRTGA